MNIIKYIWIRSNSHNHEWFLRCFKGKKKNLVTQILTHGLIEIHIVALQGLFRWLSLSKKRIMLRKKVIMLIWFQSKLRKHIYLKYWISYLLSSTHNVCIHFFLLLPIPTTIQLVSVCQVSTSSTRSNRTVLFKFLPVFYGRLKYHYDMPFSKNTAIL